MVEYLGWAATAVFVGSYFCARPAMLRTVQMVGALMWVAYGILIQATPVMVANLLVLAAAAGTMLRARWTAANATAPAVAAVGSSGTKLLATEAD